jgi:hypothetical protein
MYIQLTTRCNMTCAHCCFSATAFGDDMSEATFRAALEYASRYDHYITLGGGEPTVHPKFLDFLGLAIVHNTSEIPPLVVTNGKRKKISLKLAELAKRGVVQADLSQDEYHDPISEEVVLAFTPKDRSRFGYDDRDNGSSAGIRTVNHIMPVGRAVDNWLHSSDTGCCCEDLLVAPDGTLYACGCKTIKLGTITDPQIPADYDSEWAHSEAAQEFLTEPLAKIA